MPLWIINDIDQITMACPSEESLPVSITCSIALHSPLLQVFPLGMLRDRVSGYLTSYPPDSFRYAFHPAVSASVVCASRIAGPAMYATTAIIVHNFIYAPVFWRVHGHSLTAARGSASGVGSPRSRRRGSQIRVFWFLEQQAFLFRAS